MTSLKHPPLLVILVVLGLALSALFFPTRAAPQDNTTYYISSSAGDDDNDGLTPENAFATVAKVNSLDLLPGDEVLFVCGDVWRAEALVITHSGTAENPITFGSYPADCADKPALSGTQPITGWAIHSGSIYVADLNAGGNAGLFPDGINQLFRDDERQMLGRWPNIDANADGGYTTVDAQPSGDQITDNELPPGNWAGAVIHLKGMRWYMLNREVTSSSGTTLTLGSDANCWNGCAGWGYFIQSHLATLDQDGEWYYDEAANRVYLFTDTDPNSAEIEGAVILADEDDAEYYGAIILGQHLQAHIDYVIIENFAIQKWFGSGISTPINLEADHNSHLTIQNNTITDVDATGIKLATWVWNASGHGNGPNGWRGGDQLLIANNVIDGANHFGIDTYSTNSQYLDNEIRNIGLIANVNRSGLGCGFSGSNCTENGAGIRIKLDEVEYSANGNTLQYNWLEKIGMNGVDVFGPNNTLANNVIRQACYTKGDCGAVRTFGRDNLNDTKVYNITIRDNIIVDTIGNTDGAHETYSTVFGFGLYIDHYSKDVEVSGNTVISTTITGILYQNSTGAITGNTVYNTSTSTPWASAVNLTQSATAASLQGNTLYALGATDRTLAVTSLANITASDNNAFFHPYAEDQINSDAGTQTLAEWQAYSGYDAGSTQHWFSLGEGEARRSRIFYNDTKSPLVIDLGLVSYLDLDQNVVEGSLMLQPFTSQVLIENGQIAPEPELHANPPALFFGELAVGNTSPTQTITLENTGTAPLTLNSLAASGDFAHTHNCPLSPATLEAGQTCTVEVTFSPTAAGVRTGALTIQHDAPNAPTTIPLTGGLRQIYLPIIIR